MNKLNTIIRTILTATVAASVIACGAEGDLANSEDELSVGAAGARRYYDACKTQSAIANLWMSNGVVSREKVGYAAYSGCKRFIVDTKIPYNSGAPSHYDAVNIGVDVPLKSTLTQSTCSSLSMSVRYYKKHNSNAFTYLGTANFSGQWQSGFGAGCKLIRTSGYNLGATNPPSWGTTTIRTAASAKYGVFNQQMKVTSWHQAIVY